MSCIQSMKDSFVGRTDMCIFNGKGKYVVVSTNGPDSLFILAFFLVV